MKNYALNLLEIEFKFMTMNLTAMMKEAKKAPDTTAWVDIQELQLKIASLKEGIERLSN